MLENDIVPQLKARKNKVVIYPAQDKIFRAFKECPLDKVKVVILGQDPYHDGSANGLCFDNTVGGRISPSLRNILNKMNKTTTIRSDEELEGSYFAHLPAQGVLMLNTALTVERHKPGTHTKIWKPFTEAVVKTLNEVDDIIWILWGGHALSYKDLITNDTHDFVISSHPSPFSVNRPLRSYLSFEESKPFERVNEILYEKNKTQIRW